jgi:OmpA-OmpF porin, OOP family
MRHLDKLIAGSVFATAAVLALGGATLAVNVVESTGKRAIAERFEEAGLSWAQVETDGLQVTLTGTAQTEAMRFRALSLAGDVVDPARVINLIEVATAEALEPPRFTMELLRNDDGISLIGLVPMAFGRGTVQERIEALTGAADIANMLDSTDHPVPDGWTAAVDFGLQAMALLPRSKISISAGRVEVTAISDSREQQRAISTQLARNVPDGLRVSLDISAPRPVIAPFTLRFVIDDDRGPRFDACAADTEAAQARILAAAAQAGAPEGTNCTIGLGVPTTSWGVATEAGIAALASLGSGTITYSDADVSLIVPHTVAEDAFDAASGGSIVPCPRFSRSKRSAWIRRPTTRNVPIHPSSSPPCRPKDRCCCAAAFRTPAPVTPCKALPARASAWRRLKRPLGLNRPCPRAGRFGCWPGLRRWQNCTTGRCAYARTGSRFAGGQAIRSRAM